MLSDNLCPATEFTIQAFLDKSLWNEEKDIEYLDTTYNTELATSFEECQTLCENDPSCKGFVYKSSKCVSKCELKESMDHPILKPTETNESSTLKGIKVDKDKSKEGKTFGSAAKRPQNVIPGSMKDKRNYMYNFIASDAGGPIFTCPVSPDPYEIPVDLNVRVYNSIKELKPVLLVNLMNLTSALQCSPDIMDTMKKQQVEQDAAANKSSMGSMQGKVPEGFRDYIFESLRSSSTELFEDIKSPNPTNLTNPTDLTNAASNQVCTSKEIAEQDALKKKAEKRNAAKNGSTEASNGKKNGSGSSSSSSVSSTLTDEQKVFFLQTRVTLLESILSNQAVAQALLDIKTMHEKLETIRAKAKEGTLRPTCMNEPLKGYTKPTGPSVSDRLNALKAASKDDPSADVNTLDDHSIKILNGIMSVHSLIRSIG